jgi:hypothetical protein
MKKFLTLALASAATLSAVAVTSTPADAQWRHGGYHRGWDRGHHYGWRGPAVVYGYSYYGCRIRWRWDPYLGRNVRVRVCY